MFQGNNLPYELLFTTRQTIKLRNAIENNMSHDIKLSKAQISKKIQSGGFLGALLNNIAGICSIGKKYFNFIRNSSCCCSNWSNSKENAWFLNSNFNNFK